MAHKVARAARSSPKPLAKPAPKHVGKSAPKPTEKPAAPRGRSVAVTGAFGFLGRRLLARLEADPGVEHILALDVKPPAGVVRKTVFERIDLASPRADAQMARALQQAKVDTLVHLAFFFNPIQNAEYAHEVEVAGTLQVLGAAAAAKVSALVVCSTTTLYGAHPDNPNYLREDQPLRPPPHSRYMSDKLEVEKQVAAFAKDHPKIRVSVLRLGSMLGPTIKNPAANLFGRQLVPTVLGRDPLLQFLHEEDGVEAVFRAAMVRPTGPFNIVPPGVLPLSSVIQMLGRTPLPLPAPLAQSGLATLWSMFGVGTPPSWLDYLQYLWIADGTKACEALGLRYRYTTRETVLAFGAAHGSRSAAALAAPSDGGDLLSAEVAGGA